MASPLPSVQTAEELLERRQSLRAIGKKLVLTNGCFDLLHPGHLTFLAQASKLGDALWIGLNGDQSVAALKGPTRPILSETERAFMLLSLRSVQAVFVFQTPRLDREIDLLEPDIYTKAGDYSRDTLDRAEFAALERCNASLVFIPYLEGFSTTRMIQKINQAAQTF
ncbi:MAG: adenylyltransferase/cytidyltransferase family protein [Puniceicoccaceae bacterium]